MNSKTGLFLQNSAHITNFGVQIKTNLTNGNNKITSR